MSQSNLKAALSPDESLVAVVVPSSDRGVIQVYQTESGLLQSTLTTRQANNLQASGNTQSSVNLQSVLFCGNNHVVARTASSVLLWDLTRGGVVAHAIADDNSKTCLGAACHDGKLYLLMGISKGNSRRSSASGGGSDEEDSSGTKLKLVVHVYDPTSGRLLRKIKGGKSDGTDADEFGIALKEANGKLQVAVRCNGFRVYDAATGEKVHKHKIKDDNKRVKKDGTGGSGLHMCSNFVAVPRLSGVALYNMKANKWLDAVAASSSQPSVRLWQDDESVLLLVDQTLYSCSDAGTGVIRKLKAKQTLTLLPRSQNRITAVLYDQSVKSSLQIQTVNWELKEDEMETSEMVLKWLTEEAATAKAEETALGSSSSTKRTAQSLTVLGPGQAGGESTAVTEHRKKQKVDEQGEGEEEGVSIADRLKKLSQVLDEDEDDSDGEDKQVRDPAFADFVAQKATTESLSKLLGQALQGGDDGLLELALAVHNKTVIRETIAGLEGGHVDVLMTKLTLRLASKPNRADQLAQWLSLVLLSGKIRQKHQLLPLKNLLQERLEAFPLLLQLEGRLAMVKAHTKQHA